MKKAFVAFMILAALCCLAGTAHAVVVSSDRNVILSYNFFKGPEGNIRVRLTISNHTKKPITTDKQFTVIFGDGTNAAVNVAGLAPGKDMSLVCPQKWTKQPAIKSWSCHWHF